MMDHPLTEPMIGLYGELASQTQPRGNENARPTWAEINIDSLVHNLDVMKGVVGPGVGVMCAIKADAYGHGAVRCATVLERAGIDWFGVALPEEGEVLRRAGITQPILCLGGFWDGQEDFVIAQNLTPTVFRVDQLERLDRAAARACRVWKYHLKVDTGMGRLGVSWKTLPEFLAATRGLMNVSLDGLMTHLASADLPEKAGFTEDQITAFADALSAVQGQGHKPAWIHMANSAATMAFPESRGNLVRLGGAIYGIWRDATDPAYNSLDLRPVMSVRTKIMLLKTYPAGAPLGYGCTFVTNRESVIATLPIGYSDGLRRSLSNGGRVLVRGRKAEIVGRVSMDLTNVDVTDIPDVALGDEVVILGSQGGLDISAECIAAECGTIGYEITCGLSDRVPRFYVSGA
jgi:alanine racemase